MTSMAAKFRAEALDSTTTTLQGLAFTCALQETLMLGGALNVAFENNRAQQAALLGLSGVLEIVAVPVLGRLSDEVGRRTVLAGCAGAMASTRLLTGVLGTTALSPAALDLVLVTALSSGFAVTSRALLVDFTDSDAELARALLRVALAGTAGATLGPGLGMALAHYSDSKLRVPYMVAGVVAAGVSLASLVRLEDKPAAATTKDDDLIAWTPFALGRLVAAVPSRLIVAAAMQFVVSTEPARQVVETLARVRFGASRTVLVRLFVAQALSSIVGLGFALHMLKRTALRQFTLYATAFKVASGVLLAAVPPGPSVDAVLALSVLLDVFALRGHAEAEAALLRARPGNNGETSASLSNMHTASSMLTSVALGALGETSDARAPLVVVSGLAATAMALMR